jgi:hypothetical protein
MAVTISRKKTDSVTLVKATALSPADDEPFCIPTPSVVTVHLADVAALSQGTTIIVFKILGTSISTRVQSDTQHCRRERHVNGWKREKAVSD